MGDRLEIKYINVDELHAYENNPRLNDDAVPFVEASIRDFGMKVPIVVDANNTIVCGHTRVRACKNLGIEDVPCIVADDLDEDQINAFRLADNKVAELAGWDFAKLDLELDNLNGVFDMEDFGFSLEDFDQELEGLESLDPFGGVEASPSDDDVREVYGDVEPDDKPSSAPVVQAKEDFPDTGVLVHRGDIIFLGKHIVACGYLDRDKDLCLDAFGDVKADLAFVMLPYTCDVEAEVSSLIDTARVVYIGMSVQYPWQDITAVMNRYAGQFKDMLYLRNTAAKTEDAEFLTKTITPIMALSRTEFGPEFKFRNGAWDGVIEASWPGQAMPLSVPTDILKNVADDNYIMFSYNDPYGSCLIACEDQGCVSYHLEPSPAACQYIVKRYIERTGSDEDVVLMRDDEVIDVKWY